jgi:hypothetical protein
LRLFVSGAASGPVTVLARGRTYRRRDCGHAVTLDDVSSSGEVLYEEAIVPCPRRTGRFVVRAQRSGEPPRTLVSARTDGAFVSFGPPFRSLAGRQLLTVGERRARVRDLDTGAVRRLLPVGDPYGLGPVDVAADGRVLINELGFVRGRPPEQVIRLLGSHHRNRGGEVVHRTRREYGDARFCGSQAILFTVTARGRYTLRTLDPAAELYRGTLPDPDVETACDDRFLVATVAVAGRADRVFAFRLPAPAP